MIRWFGTIGAMFGFAGVLLAAMASHVLAAKLGLDDLRRVSLAATFCFVQGVALVSLAFALRQVRGLVLAIAGHAWWLGTLVFCGSLVGRALFGWTSVLAPFGGVLMMAGWLALASWFAFARR